MKGSLPSRQDAVNTNRTPAGEALSRLVVLVFRLEGALKAVGDSLARPAGQTSARWRVLAAVEATPMSVAQIARAWSFARQSVQRVADELERDGLITYEENPGHKRAKLVQLTPPGAAALAQIQAAQRAWADELGGQIDAEDLARASDILGRILEAPAMQREPA
jgi:DNA-binding MarR family transcriptional regulator